MEYQKVCRRCYVPFKTKRAETEFCTDKCAAAWARENGYERERFHAEKPEWIKKNCAECGTIFEYNEYAKRAGARVPQYCSNKCRQAAYRARKAAAGESASYTGNWEDARNDKSSSKQSKGTSHEYKKTWQENVNEHENRRGRGDKGTQQPPRSDKGTSQSSTNKGTQQPPLDKRWKSKDVYEILGVTYLSTPAQIKAAWKKLLRTYHPDISKEANAEAIAKAINWAYDRITNTGKTRR